MLRHVGQVVVFLDALRWLFSPLGAFGQAATLVDKNSKKFTGATDHGKLLSRWDFPEHEVVIAMKSARIVPYLASDAVRWQEDYYNSTFI